MSTPDPERLARETAKGIVQMFRHADAYDAPEITEEDVCAHVLASIRTVAPQPATGEANTPLVWRSNKFLREAFVETIAGLRQRLLRVSFTLFDKPQQSAPHLLWMLDELDRKLDRFPVDKTGRWIGYVQGVLACNGFLDVNEERDRTRPLFQKAYSTAEAIAPFVGRNEDTERLDWLLSFDGGTWVYWANEYAEWSHAKAANRAAIDQARREGKP